MAICEDRETGEARILRSKHESEPNITKLEVRAINRGLNWVWNNYKNPNAYEIHIYTDCLEAVKALKNKQHWFFKAPKKSKMKVEWGELSMWTKKLHVKAFHVKSHTGDPMNEMADTLAGSLHSDHAKCKPDVKPLTFWCKLKVMLGFKLNGRD